MKSQTLCNQKSNPEKLFINYFKKTKTMFILVFTDSNLEFEFCYSKKFSEIITSNFFITVKSSHIKSHFNSNQRTKRAFNF